MKTESSKGSTGCWLFSSSAYGRASERASEGAPRTACWVVGWFRSCRLECRRPREAPETPGTPGYRLFVIAFPKKDRSSPCAQRAQTEPRGRSQSSSDRDNLKPNRCPGLGWGRLSDFLFCFLFREWRRFSAIYLTPRHLIDLCKLSRSPKWAPERSAQRP